MYELKQLYNKVNKQSQNHIEQWGEQGLLNGYFGMLAKKIYSRTRVKNNEILELLIYSVYMEEQQKLKQSEINIFKEDMNHYYEIGQEEVIKAQNKKKKASILTDAIFLALLDQPLYKRLTYNQQVQAAIQYNVQQI